MKNAPSAPAALLVAAILLLGGCSNTSIVTAWSNPHFAGPRFGKIMVVRISRQAVVRRLFEDEAVRQLQARGGQALASYTLLPHDGPLPEDQLKATVQKSGVDGVLLIRLVARERHVDYEAISPGYYGPFPGFYSYAWNAPVMMAPYEYDVLTLEARLYNAANQELVWAGTVETVEPHDNEKEIARCAEVIVDALSKKKLI